MYSIQLRPLELHHSEISWKWRNDSTIWENTGSKPDVDVTPEIERAWIEKAIYDVNSKRFAITVDDFYVGNIQLTNITEKDAQYHIFIGNKEFWGKGIAFSVTQQIIRYAQNEMGLQMLYLFVKPNHSAALRLYEKAGFKLVSPEVRMELNLRDTIKPIVSIFCMVYNHEPFLQKCLDGFMMQKCKFDFEIVLGEDCSTDNSRNLILNFAKMYPGKFKLILHKYNVGANANQKLVFENCKGKYIAMCEGDDYWTDPLKLQKQVDFLEMHHHYSMVAHKVFIDVNGHLNKFIYGHQEFSLENILHHGPLVHTASILFRNVLSENDLDLLTKVTLGDWMLVLLLSKHGKIKLLEDYMAAYRIHENGVYAPLSIENKVKKNIEFQMNVISVFPEFKNLLLKEIDSKMKFYSLYDYSLKSYLKGNSSLRIFLYGLRVKLNLKNRIFKIINRKSFNNDYSHCILF